MGQTLRFLLTIPQNDHKTMVQWSSLIYDLYGQYTNRCGCHVTNLRFTVLECGLNHYVSVFLIIIFRKRHRSAFSLLVICREQADPDHQICRSFLVSSKKSPQRFQQWRKLWSRDTMLSASEFFHFRSMGFLCKAIRCGVEWPRDNKVACPGPWTVETWC